ncbi:hypothetical protein SteCoe_12403 [Stentor coeruleus]|uniref:Uncharacterized protein n=1 Tax=Stentor coeruleus TaxID=5963 RepID=A0A1R2CAU8_9CILI|nr:hypothetical protein SteCoe_12403 [Stentor coeruleus]
MSLSFHTAREVKTKSYIQKDRRTPIILSESESSSCSLKSSVSDMIKDDEQIEKIKYKNRDLIRKVSDKMMSFKHTSRYLLELTKGKLAQSPIDLECISNKPSSRDNNCQVNNQSFNAKGELNIGMRIKDISTLRQQHRKTQSVLVENLEELAIVEQEKYVLKRELQELQERFIYEHKGLKEAKCCNIY